MALLPLVALVVPTLVGQVRVVPKVLVALVVPLASVVQVEPVVPWV